MSRLAAFSTDLRVVKSGSGTSIKDTVRLALSFEYNRAAKSEYLATSLNGDGKKLPPRISVKDDICKVILWRIRGHC